jgi:hypothetical protein
MDPTQEKRSYEYDIERSCYFRSLTIQLAEACNILPPLVRITAQYAVSPPRLWLDRLTDICDRYNNDLRPLMGSTCVGSTCVGPYVWQGETLTMYYRHTQKTMSQEENTGWNMGWDSHYGYRWDFEPKHNQKFLQALQQQTQTRQSLDDLLWFNEFQKTGVLRQTNRHTCIALETQTVRELVNCFREMEAIYGADIIFTCLSSVDDSENVPLLLLPDIDASTSQQYTGAAIVFQDILL